MHYKFFEIQYDAALFQSRNYSHSFSSPNKNSLIRYNRGKYDMSFWLMARTQVLLWALLVKSMQVELAMLEVSTPMLVSSRLRLLTESLVTCQMLIQETELIFIPVAFF